MTATWIVHTAIGEPIDFPAPFWSLVAQRAAVSPDHLLVETDDGRSLTAHGLHDAAEAVAAGLAARGVTGGTRVSWQLPTTYEAVVLLCALARLGAVQNPLIPILRHREVGLIVGETEADLLVTPSTWRRFDHESMAREVAAEHGCDVLVVDQGGLPTGDPGTLPPPPPDDEAVRFVYYSSGTTAVPKGGRLTDRAVMATANGIITNMGVGGDDCLPIPFPITHIGGIVFLTTALHTGCRLVLVERWDPAATPLELVGHQPTLLGSALPFFRAYIDAQRRHGTEPLYPALRAFVGGGAPKPPEIHHELVEVFGVGILSGWGLTECAIATSSCPDDDDQERAHTEGRPSPGVELRVVDRDGRDLPAGEEGELRVRAPQMLVGYADARLDEEAFDEQGFLRTGDLGLVGPRGHVQITGRIKDVIIRNAENISAQEVEDALYTHPAIADVAVVGVPDERTGERAVAVVVAAPGQPTIDLAGVVAHCRAEGLAMQKIPEGLELREELPRNALGKIVKEELRRALVGSVDEPHPGGK